MTPKRTELEQEVWRRREELAMFGAKAAPLGLSKAEYIAVEAKQRADRDEMLNLAYRDGVWLVNVRIAIAVANGRWWNAMMLSEWQRAEEEMRRLAPLSREFERSDRLDIPARIQISRLFGGEDDSVQKLVDLASEEIYEPRVSARRILQLLSAWLDFYADLRELPSEVNELLTRLGELMQVKKRYVQACRAASTWSECLAAAELLVNKGK